MNIAKILKDKPKGTKLYDYLYQKEVELEEVWANGDIWCTRNEENNTVTHYGYSELGTLRNHEDSLQILFPSKAMRDWSKFAWMEGCFLLGKDKKTLVLFCDWANDDYSKFTGATLPTSCGEEMGAKTTYNTCDYDFIDLGNYTLGSCINPTTGEFCFKVEPKESQEPNKPKEPTEPQFEHVFKPFEKVLVRDYFCDKWRCDFFSHMAENEYDCIGNCWLQCLPYNEETAKLIGTTKSLEDIETKQA